MEPPSASVCGAALEESRRSTCGCCEEGCCDVGLVFPITTAGLWTDDVDMKPFRASPFSGSQPLDDAVSCAAAPLGGGLYIAPVGWSPVLAGGAGIMGGLAVSPWAWLPVSNSTPSVGTSVIPNIAQPKQHNIKPACVEKARAGGKERMV